MKTSKFIHATTETPGKHTPITMSGVINHSFSKEKDHLCLRKQLLKISQANQGKLSDILNIEPKVIFTPVFTVMECRNPWNSFHSLTICTQDKGRDNFTNGGTKNAAQLWRRRLPSLWLLGRKLKPLPGFVNMIFSLISVTITYFRVFKGK